MPKIAPLETVLFVPVLGPKMAIPAKEAEPMIEPTRIAVAADHQLSPKVIGRAPRMKAEKLKLAPKNAQSTFLGFECRSSGGMKSMPCVSTLPNASTSVLLGPA